MAKLPHAYIIPGLQNNETLVRPPVAPSLQYPGNVQDVESSTGFQLNSLCYMQPRLFNPNFPPPPPFPPTENSAPPPSIKTSYGRETSLNVSSYAQYPQWPLHWNPQASHPGFSTGIGYPHFSVETSTSPFLVDNSVPQTPAVQSRIYAPVLEISDRTDKFEVGEISGVNRTETNPDQIWANSWLQRYSKGPVLHSSSGASGDKKLKVWEAKQLLQSCWSNLRELEALEEEMTLRCKELMDCDWNKMLEEVELRKAMLREHLEKIDNNALESVKVTLLKRSKKRARERRKCVLEKENGYAAAERRKKLHLHIDMWLEKKQAEVDLQKREESMKQEADAVLWEVRRKQSEGRKTLSLLASLVKLYQVRAKKNESSTNSESSETKEQFKKIIDKLVGLWEGQMKDYEAEERTLRVMLQESPEKGEEGKDKRKNEMNKLERNFREWETLLFGKDSMSEELSSIGAATYQPFFLNQSKSLDSLVDIRRQWDHFISNTPSASSIPIGWVVPQEASSEEWSKMIK